MEFAEVLEKAGKEGKVRLITFHNAVITCTKEYQANPTEAKLRDLRAAEEALKLEIDVQNGNGGNDGAGTKFKNRAAAWRWVEEQIKGRGVSLSQRKFYDDGPAGKYLTYPDKTVSRSSVAEYLLQLVVEAPVTDLDLVDRSQEKNRLELRKLELEVSRLEIKTRAEDREWMLTDDHWAQLMAGYNVLRGNLEHHARMAASEIVLEVGGDYHQGPLVADKVVELVINRAFNELAGVRVDSGKFEHLEEYDGEQEDERQ